MTKAEPSAQIVRAVVLREINTRPIVENITLDPPEPTEVLVRMKAVGLCHTEQHALKGEIPLGMTPIVLGHEGAGVVEAVGPDVHGIDIGDHVALLWRPVCRQCEPCQQGQHHRCRSGDQTNHGLQFDGTYRRRDASGKPIGSFCMTGAFAEKTVVDQASVVVVGRDIPFEVVALASCCVVGGYGAIMNSTTVKTGDTVLIVGAGGQGNIAVQAARIAGAARVIAADRHQCRLDQAREMGATDTILVTAVGQLAGRIAALTADQWVDHAIICAGSVDALTEAYRSTKSGGSVVLSGIPPTTALNIPLLPIEVLTGNGKTLVGSQYGGISQLVGIPQVLDQYRCGKLRVKELITRWYSLGDVARGYDDLAAGGHGRGLVRLS